MLYYATNLSVDHKIPSARGGSQEISNLQFVYYDDVVDINVMKHTMTDEEFLAAVRMIYMHHYLPKVNPEVGFSISRSFKDDADYYNRMMKLIKKENPAVGEFIERWSAKGDEEDDCPLHTAFCGILVYAMLRGQAESNHMEETIKL